MGDWEDKDEASKATKVSLVKKHGTCRRNSAEEVFREEVFREEAFREEAAREEAAREEAVREEASREEAGKEESILANIDKLVTSCFSLIFWVIVLIVTVVSCLSDN